MPRMTTRKMNLCIISEIRDCLDLFSAPMALENLNVQSKMAAHAIMSIYCNVFYKRVKANYLLIIGVCLRNKFEINYTNASTTGCT